MFALFWALWVVLNGSFTAEIAIVGVVVSLLMTLLTCKMENIRFRDAMLGDPQAFRVIGYLFRLVHEIAKNAWLVALLIVNPKREVKPRLFYFEPRIEREGVRVLLANSITLTPGTITVGLKDGRFHVHALDPAFSNGIETSGMVRALERIDSEITRAENRRAGGKK